MCIRDRLLPGTLGDPDSLVDESHNSSLLEYPQFTRPLTFKDMKVPDILVSGNHKEIRSWREKKMLERTKDRRMDLISQRNSFINNQKEATRKIINGVTEEFHKEYSYPDW